MIDTGSEIHDPLRSIGFSQERWRERFLTLILRGASVLGLAAAVVSVIDSLSHGQIVLGGIYSAAWVLLAVITVFRRPYWLRAGVFLFLLFALGMSGLFENGMRGDARLFFLVFSAMATLLVGPRAGMAVLGFCLLMIAAFAPFAISGRVHLLSKVTVAGDAQLWVTGSVEFLFLGAAILSGLTLLLQQFTRAQERLIESATKFSKVFHANPLAMSMATLSDDRFIEVNEAFQKCSGHSRAEVIGHTILELGFFDDPAKFGKIRQLLVVDGSIRNLEIQLRIKDRGLLTCLLAVEPIELAGEHCYVFAITDISDRKRLEEQLRHAQKMEAIGQLAGGVAHDFNNILAATMMNLDLLKEDQSLNVNAREVLDELKVEAGRAANLTRRLLMFSRRSVLDVRALNLNEVVDNLLKMLGRLVGENYTLVFERSNSVPLVEADAGMLEQVLLNLVVNARDAMPGGGRITLSTSAVKIDPVHATANPDRRVGRFGCLSVSDTGCGMDAVTLKRIFEPFFTTKAVGKGTGLGLATVYGIASQHRGWVEVESQMGQGATFRTYLPVAKTKLVERKDVGPSEVPKGQETILVVEDDERVRRLVAKALCTLGYRVFEADNGQEAMTLWRSHGSQIDLLITDMVMPEGMTGFELAKKVRIEKPHLKIIISSGYSAEATHVVGPTIDGIVYLPKPYQMSELGVTIRQCLDRR